MDANGLRFWMVADAADWAAPADLGALRYDTLRRVLELKSERPADERPVERVFLPGDTTLGERLQRVPATMDAFGNVAWYLPGSPATIRSAGALGDASVIGSELGGIEIFRGVGPETVTDFAIGTDGVITMCLLGRVEIVDPRGRWEGRVARELPGFVAWRLAPRPEGGAWILGEEGELVLCAGLPPRDLPGPLYHADVWRPLVERPEDVRLTLLAEAAFPDERAVALAVSPGGRLGLLFHHVGGNARVRIWENNRFSNPVELLGARFPYALTWIDETRVAVRIEEVLGQPPNTQEAPAYDLDGPSHAEPVGERYLLRRPLSEPFVHSVDGVPRYRSELGVLPLRPLSMPRRARRGEVQAKKRLDTHDADTTWHRLYLEAELPPGCGITVWLAATDDGLPPAIEPEEAPAGGFDWHRHDFGATPGDPRLPEAPRGAWVPQPSELSHHPGLLASPPKKDRCGLFTALVQRADRHVRALKGRFLHVRVALHGDGVRSPVLAAARVYGSRFSYLDRYLPELYRETAFGPEAEEVGRSSAPDFLERFLDNFEGILTTMEDRVAGAWTLTEPSTTPDAALDWLATWSGIVFDPAFSPRARRRVLQAGPELVRKRGTLAGLTLLLDLVTDGAVEGGRLLLLEDWRVRRTWATILGADLADEDDPLLVGFVQSGNSYVGDTLVLGDESKREFLALYSDDVATDEEREVVDAFYERTAHRLTLLAHADLDPDIVGLVERLVRRESPAHVLTRVHRASRAFIVGMAALVGVDTFLAPAPTFGTVRLGETRLGVRDLVRRLASLDPRLEGDGT